MKRSESFLVYGVTGVLVVILAIAIIFGNEAQPADPGSEGDSKVASTRFDDGEFFDESDPDGGDRSTNLLDELLGDENTLIDGPAGGAEEADAAEDDPVELATNRVGGGPVEIPLNRTLGPSRVEENPPASGNRYRIVEVQPGDSTSVLIQRWCPGTDRAIVAALNETVSLDRLRVAQELVLPWVDTAILLETQRSRLEAEASTPSTAVVPGTRGVQPAAAVNAGATTHTVRAGESLWKIAEAKVGKKQATNYVNEIVRANDSISDASRVREGMKIILP